MGHIQKRGPKCYKARYRGPDGRERSKTFHRKIDAVQWLTKHEATKATGEWAAPELGRLPFKHYAELHLETLTTTRTPSTISAYRSYLRNLVLP